MIGILKYLTVRQLAESQDHMVMSPTDFGEAQAKANMRGYKKGREEAIEEITKRIKEFVANYGTVPNHFNIDKIAEQLKEKNNDKADTSIYPEMRANKKGPAES